MLTIRSASISDASEVARLWTVATRARRHEIQLPAEPVPGADVEQSELITCARLSTAGAFAVIAEDGDRVVAMALAMPALSHDGAGIDEIPGLMHISMVAVHPDRWGQRLAATVLDRLLAEGRHRRFDRAQLWTQENNQPAQRLYERLGWRASGRTKIDDHGEKMRHYVCNI